MTATSSLAVVGSTRSFRAGLCFARLRDSSWLIFVVPSFSSAARPLRRYEPGDGNVLLAGWRPSRKSRQVHTPTPTRLPRWGPGKIRRAADEHRRHRLAEDVSWVFAILRGFVVKNV